MLNMAENSVKIEGVLSEVDLDYGSYVKNGETIETVGGSIKVRVNQTLNGKEVELDVPVYMFANKMTKAHKTNPAYESIDRVKNEFVSIAAGGMEKADRIRITNANIRMNEYYNSNGILNSYPRIQASFVSKITDMNKYSPEATFSVVFTIGSMGPDQDKDGRDLEDRYKIRGILPQYGGVVDVVDFYAINPNVINAVSSFWQEGDTVKINGKLNFTSRVEEKQINVDFGEPRVEKRTISISELIITGGSQEPLHDDFAFDADEITQALKVRQAHLEELKEKAQHKAKSHSNSAGSAAATRKKTFEDVGF